MTRAAPRSPLNISALVAEGCNAKYNQQLRIHPRRDAILPEVNDEFNRAQNSGFDDLCGKTAVVTGSSSGIGSAIACKFAEAGAAVLVHGRSRERAEPVCERIRALGAESTYQLADLAVASSVDQFADRAWDWRDGVDIWVNNAGADVLTGPAADWTFEQKLEHLWQVDVVATIRLSRIVGQKMKKKGESAADRVILNVGWDQAETGMEGDSGEMFAAIKGAVAAFSKSLAYSLAPEVRVNCLAPGWIKTAWGDTASEYWQRRARSESLLERWGTPQDVARAALFLASPENFVSGHVLPVNGGRRGVAGGQ